MANAYDFARVYRTQSVLTTSPGHLVLMLYDGALRFLDQAKDALAEPEGSARRIERINNNLNKAQNIIAELQATLNMEVGEHSRHLHRLYDYYLRRLFEANMKKTVEPVDEVMRLVRVLRDGWAEMLRQEEVRRFEETRASA